MSYPRVSALWLLVVVSAMLAASWIRYPVSFWPDPLAVVVLTFPLILAAARRSQDGAFWSGFWLLGAAYLFSLGGASNLFSWCLDLGIPVRFLMSSAGAALLNVLDSVITFIVGLAGGVIGFYLFPWSARVVATALANPSRLQFSMWSLVAVTGLFAVAFSLPEMFIPLAMVCMCASLLGVAVANVMSVEPRRRRFLCAVCFGAAGGLLISPFQIAFEWSGAGHPWPTSDSLYVVSVFLRCSLLGAAIGFVVWHSLNLLRANASL